jgi:hypothetical protein
LLDKRWIVLSGCRIGFVAILILQPTFEQSEKATLGKIFSIRPYLCVVYPVHQTMPAVERAWRSFMPFKQLLPGQVG